MSSRLLLISPVRNESAHIERVVRAVAGQTRTPDAWVVVDDGSSDGTFEIVDRLRTGAPFLSLIARDQDREPEAGGDRLATAAAPRAFNAGLRTVDWREFTHIGKLDGDVELPPDYFERLLAEFDADPTLGIACGDLVEGQGADERRIRIPSHHVHGALKLYRSECFEAIGGVQERLGWDTIDETYARMKGFTTRSFRELVARHHRAWGSADGTLRGRARHGHCAHVAGYTLLWALLRSAKLATVRPFGLSGLAFLHGYLGARLRRLPRVEDREFRRYVRRELRGRLLRPFKSAATT
jgi:glycosyltransferase involved in cell wall biosynthesis